MEPIRLQKFLAAAGVCSRRKGEAYIQAGLVTVNGRVVTELGTRVDPDRDRVAFRGKVVRPAESRVYIALNKPVGFVTSCRQPGEVVVLELIDLPERVFPIGRLDKDSRGLLLLTNDGSIHHRLLHPSFDHEKEYEVTLAYPIADGALRKIASGMPMMDRQTRPATVRRLSGTRFRIILKEGRNRQIRRMVRKVGGRVEDLKRIRVANVRLGDLQEGRWRHLTEEERQGLLEPG